MIYAPQPADALPLEADAAAVPKPALAAAVDNVWLHSLGAVVKASHIAFFIASGVLLLGWTFAPLIVNEGLPVIPSCLADAMSVLYNASASEAMHESIFALSIDNEDIRLLSNGLRHVAFPLQLPIAVFALNWSRYFHNMSFP